MKSDDLLKFCSSTIKRINKPWSAGDFSYATNGHILIRVPRLEDVPGNLGAPKIERIEKLFPSPLPVDFVPIPEPDVVTKTCPECNGKATDVECPECYGSGTVDLENAYNDYECDCKSCDATGRLPKCEYCNGTGKITEHHHIKIGGTFYDSQYLVLIKDLPGIEISPTPPPTPAVFKFEGGIGLLAPVNMP